MQNRKEFPHILGMEPSGGLIQKVKGATRLALGEFPGEFDPLSFPAGKLGSRLAKLDVA
jgi:hypothetical protein